MVDPDGEAPRVSEEDGAIFLETHGITMRYDVAQARAVAAALITQADALGVTAEAEGLPRVDPGSKDHGPP